MLPRHIIRPHGVEPRGARRLEPWAAGSGAAPDGARRRSNLSAINALFLARDQSLVWRSAAIASTMRSDQTRATVRRGAVWPSKGPV